MKTQIKKDLHKLQERKELSFKELERRGIGFSDEVWQELQVIISLEEQLRRELFDYNNVTKEISVDFKYKDNKQYSTKITSGLSFYSDDSLEKLDKTLVRLKDDILSSIGVQGYIVVHWEDGELFAMLDYELPKHYKLHIYTNTPDVIIEVQRV